jgi:hypothetical protein
MKVWIVSLVKRGFIAEPEIFCKASEAEKRKQALLDDFNPDYDPPYPTPLSPLWTWYRLPIGLHMGMDR